MKYVKSNIGFIIILVFLTALILIPEFKAAILKGIMKTSLYDPVITTSSNNPSQSNQALVKAPGANFISSSGYHLNLADTKGKVVFVSFWATWCPPCIAEMPSIQALKTKLKDNSSVIFVMVDADSNLPAASAFMKSNNYDLQVYQQNGVLPESFFNGSLPTTVIINRQGEIVMKHEGLRNYDTSDMLKFLNSLSR